MATENSAEILVDTHNVTSMILVHNTNVKMLELTHREISNKK